MLTYEKLLDLIFEKYPSSSLKEIQIDLAKLLHLAPASIYNKLKKRSQFTLEEYLIIARHLNISLDMFTLQSQSKSIQFLPDSLSYQVTSFESYIGVLLENVELAARLNPKNVYQVCSQPTLFHLLDFPHLFYLKLFVYNYTIWGNKSLLVYNSQDFIKSNKMRQNLLSLKKTYSSIPSVQIFCYDLLRSLCRNIECLISAKIISDTYEINKLVTEIDDFFNQLKVDTGVKLKDKNFENKPNVELYVNKFINVSNMILIEGQDSTLFTIQVDVPDVIKTVNPIFTSHVKQWILKTLNYSTQISSAGGIERNIFFDQMRREVDKIMNLSPVKI